MIDTMIQNNDEHLPLKEKTFGRYKIIAKIGAGGMGEVYKAYDPQLDRIVALKVLSKKGQTTKQDIQRFIREAQATAKLRHPNIVSVYDIGKEQGRQYFTMDFIQGVSLKALAKKAALPINQIIEIMIQIGDGIHYAHRHGIIHRDLKPANIMMEGNTIPKIMDFGLAKVLRSHLKLSQSGMVLGTLQYMPPEQAKGQINAIDERSDVYGLGAILYELLTGQPPFGGPSSFAILYQVIHKDPVPPRQIRRVISKELDCICLKALEKEKARRYASAASFADDLNRLARGAPIQARPIGRLRRMLRYLKRHKTLVVIIALGLLSCILALQLARHSPRLLEQARKLEAENNYESAFYIYHRLVKDSAVAVKQQADDHQPAPDNPKAHDEQKAGREACEGFIRNGTQLVISAFAQKDWKRINELSRLFKQSTPFLSQADINRIEKIRNLDIGTGILKISTTPAWRQRYKQLFLWDTYTHKVARLSLPSADEAVEYRLLPHEYILFYLRAASRQDKPYDYFIFKLQHNRTFEFYLRTIKVSNDEQLRFKLANRAICKPGLHIKLQKGRYNMPLMLTSRHSHIRIQGSPNVYWATPLRLVRAADIRFSGMRLWPAREDCATILEISQCRHLSLSNLILQRPLPIPLGNLNRTRCALPPCAILVEDSQDVSLVANKLDSGGWLQFGIVYRRCMGGHLEDNQITDFSQTAILLRESQDIRVHSNKIGLSLRKLRHNGVAKMVPQTGIRLYRSTMTMVSHNLCLNQWQGILVDGGSTVNVLLHNTCRYNHYGIKLLSVGFLDVIDNRLEYNEIGMQIFHAALRAFDEPIHLKCNQLQHNKVGVKLGEDVQGLLWDRKEWNIFLHNKSNVVPAKMKVPYSACQRKRGASTIFQYSYPRWPAIPIKIAQLGVMSPSPSASRSLADGHSGLRWYTANKVHFVYKPGKRLPAYETAKHHLEESPLQRNSTELGAKSQLTEAAQVGKESYLVLPLRICTPQSIVWCTPYCEFDMIVTMNACLKYFPKKGDVFQVTTREDTWIRSCYRSSKLKRPEHKDKDRGNDTTDSRRYTFYDFKDPIGFIAATRPYHFNLSWYDLDWYQHLHYFELTVHLVDLQYRMFGSRDALWLSTTINQQDVKQNSSVDLQLSGGTIIMKLVVEMRNIGESIWLTKKVCGAPVWLRCEFADLELELQNITHPLKIGVFTGFWGLVQSDDDLPDYHNLEANKSWREFYAPKQWIRLHHHYQEGNNLIVPLRWQLYLNHIIAGAHRQFGEIVNCNLHLLRASKQVRGLWIAPLKLKPRNE